MRFITCGYDKNIQILNTVNTRLHGNILFCITVIHVFISELIQIIQEHDRRRRFRCFMDTFSVIAGSGETRITADRAVSAIMRYCMLGNPDLAGIVGSGDYPAYWELSSVGENEIVVLFRSYTGAENRYYIDPVSGQTYVTERVPGIIDEERRTEESLNAWDYLF